MPGWARGRAVFIVVGLRDFSFFASDLALEAVGSAHLNLRTLERTRTRVPQAVVLTPIQLQLFRVTRTVGPDRTAIDVGTPADDLLYDLRGFHAPERDQDPARGTFRWTGPRASLTLPGGRDVTLVVAGGRPPGTPPSGRGASQKPQQTRGFVPLCPASQDFWSPADDAMRQTPRVAELLRKAIEWRALLTAGEVAAQAAIARREGITRAA